MTPAEAMRLIEGHRFAALVNLASNQKTFLRIAAQQPEVEALSGAMANEPAVLAEVGQRALALAAARAEGECEVEEDAALATYLWLLSKHRPDLAETAAGSVRGWQRFFWARKLAEDLRPAVGSANGNLREATKERTGGVTEGVETAHRKP